MKHYLVLMATLAAQAPAGAFANPIAQQPAAPAVAQVAVASNTTMPNAAQLENAAQAIVLPPTASQELRQMNTTNEMAATVPAVANQIAAEVAPRAGAVVASAPIANTDTVPAVTIPRTETVTATGTVSVGQPPAAGVALPTTVTDNTTSGAVRQPPAAGVVLSATGAVTEAAPVTATVTDTTIAAPVSTPNLTEHALLAFGAVVGLGIFGVTLVRLKKRGALGFGKSDRAQMEIISQMTLSPKRKIILVRIRDQEIALASTEHGITMLTEISSNKPAPRQSISASPVEPRLVGAARETKTRDVPSEAMASAKKSESFLNALKNIKTKATQQESTQTAQMSDEVEAAKATKSSPTLGQTRGAFPKYLANAFQQEGNRKVTGGKASAAASAQSGDEENLENVTNMIREKLKNIHQAG